MVKKIGISMPEYIFDAYLAEPRKNRSQYICQLIMLGSESLNRSGSPQLAITISKLQYQIEDLKSKLQTAEARCKTLSNRKADKERQRADRMKCNLTKGIINSGIIRNKVLEE